jgi:hypothetical protein
MRRAEGRRLCGEPPALPDRHDGAEADEDANPERPAAELEQLAKFLTGFR